MLHCDVIDDVIIMKNGIIWNDLFISEVKLKLCLIIQNFQNGRHVELATNFFYLKLYQELNMPER